MSLAIAAIKLLRDRAEHIRSNAISAENLADEAWANYLRRSESARALWREHGELTAALGHLEKGP